MDIMRIGVLCLLGVLLVTGRASADSKRVRVCLNGIWERHVGGSEAEVPSDGWAPIRVPVASDEDAEGAAWFRTDVEVPADFMASDKKVLLHFARVRHYALIRVNGQVCGDHFGQRASFDIDITKAVKPGPNQLEIFTHNAAGKYAIRGKIIDDLEIQRRVSSSDRYQRVATIAEDVFLVSRPTVYVSDVLCMPSVRNKELAVRLTVTNDTSDDATLSMKNKVYLGNDKVLAFDQETLAVAAGDETTVTIRTPWDDPQLWGFAQYGSHVLYHLATTLKTDGNVVDENFVRFGFREFWTEGQTMMFNGKPFHALGYWQPEASGKTIWQLRMASVQASGANAIHNHMEQREPSYYDAADEMGLLVWDADFCGGPLGTSPNMSQDPFPDVEPELWKQYQGWAKKVANHPSVALMMMGCILNRPTVERLAAKFSEIDHTRLLHGPGGVPEEGSVLDLRACAANFAMKEDDPIAGIKQSYQWAHDPDDPRPLINKEIWYKDVGTEGVTPEAVAKATEDAMDFLTEQDIPGYILYSNVCFNIIVPDAPVQWPSNSGLGQHSVTGHEQAFPWKSYDYVNYWDPNKPVLRPTPTFEAQQRAAKRYLGYDMPVSTTRSPQALVTCRQNGKPLADAYVFAEPVKGVVGSMQGMRTDANGVAWFELRDPGDYTFTLNHGDASVSATVHAPRQPLDLDHGGFGAFTEVTLTIQD